MNIEQKVRRKTQEINIDNFLDQIFLELINYLY